MESNKSNDIKIDKDVVSRLRTRVFLMEKENFKTKKFKDNEMTEKIRKMIEFEVNKIDN